jgi:hypothetical protein
VGQEDLLALQNLDIPMFPAVSVSFYKLVGIVTLAWVEGVDRDGSNILHHGITLH